MVSMEFEIPRPRVKCNAGSGGEAIWKVTDAWWFFTEKVFVLETKSNLSYIPSLRFCGDRWISRPLYDDVFPDVLRLTGSGRLWAPETCRYLTRYRVNPHTDSRYFMRIPPHLLPRSLSTTTLRYRDSQTVKKEWPLEIYDAC